MLTVQKWTKIRRENEIYKSEQRREEIVTKKETERNVDDTECLQRGNEKEFKLRNENKGATTTKNQATSHN